MNQPYSFCHHCGTPYPPQRLKWPRICSNQSCQKETYRPLSCVGVVLQPVLHPSGKMGLLTGERGIGPRIGEFALPGGFVEYDEDTVEMGAFRELWEETGLFPKTPTYRLMKSYNTKIGNILVFVQSMTPITEAEVAGSRPSYECPSVKVIYEPIELAFPSHTNAVKEWFESAGRGHDLVNSLTREQVSRFKKS